tara:strand:+ start:305 stop:709 length:405 start_codon:yes stop_codon:yes gene_type:complete
MFKKLYKSITENTTLKQLNKSKYVAGIAMLMLNIGSKYITIGLSKTQEEYLTSVIARQLLIFSAVFIATKDLFISLVLTLMFIFFADYIFNENSNLCILPKQLISHIDTNDDGIISDKELENAIKVLNKAKKHK